MNWKTYTEILSQYVWSEWGKPRKPAVRIVCVLAEIIPRHSSNSQELPPRKKPLLQTGIKHRSFSP
jgi:hypothetical protein